MASSRPRPTLHDVALKAKVSHMTVSRVVRGERRVSDETRKRVQSAIDALEYRPDPVMSALAAYRANQSTRSGADQIAFIDFDGNHYTQTIKSGVAAQAAILGYGLTTFRIQPTEPELKRCARLVYNRGVRGVLIGPTFQPITLTGFHWERVAAVSLGAISQEPTLHSVGMDYFQGMTLAMEELRKKGHQQFGFVIAGRWEARSAHRWLGAFLAATFLAGKTLIEPLTDEDLSMTRLRQWHRKYRPDALLTINAKLTAIASCLRPRPEVAFLNAVSAVPGYARLELDPGEIGREAVRVLHPLLMRLEFGIPALPKSVLLPCRWRDEAKEQRRARLPPSPLSI